MTLSWVSALDTCAAAGILDYDAPSYIMGKEPRYIGSPKLTDLPLNNREFLSPDIKLPQQPKIDDFETENLDTKIKNPKWKKWAFLGVGISTIMGLVMLATGKSLKLPSFKGIKNIFSNIGTHISNGWHKLVSLFKKTP